MKKFLSVLLALAVAFTFTFGSTMSAFAYTTAAGNDYYTVDEQKALLAAAYTQAVSEAAAYTVDYDQNTYNATAAKDITTFTVSKDAVVAGLDAAYAATIVTITATATDLLGAGLEGDFDATNPSKSSADVIKVKNKLLAAAKTVTDSTTGLNVVTSKAWADYQAALTKLVDSVDISVYTTTKNADGIVAKDGKTYYTAKEAAEADIAYAKAVISKAKLAASTDATPTNLNEWGAASYKALYDAVFGAGKIIKIKENKDDTIDTNLVTSLTYQLVGSYATNKSEAADAANLAVVQAQAKAALLAAITTYENGAKYDTKQDEAIAAYQEAKNYLIDNGTISGSTPSFDTNYSIGTATNLTVDDVNYIELCEAAAAAKKALADLKAEKVAEGFNWDDEVAAKALDAQLKLIYGGNKAAQLNTTGIYTSDVTPGYKASQKIDYSDIEAKEDVATHGLAYKYNNKAYYEAEWTAVKAAIDTYNAAVDAAKIGKDITDARNTLNKAVAAIAVADDVYAKVSADNSADTVKKYAGLVKENAKETIYVTFGDTTSTVTGTDGTGLDLESVYLWYIAQGARTAKEATALYGDACKVVDAYKTLSTLKAEAAAVVTQIANLPATPAVTDKEAVIAAKDAYDALPSAGQSYVTNVVTLNAALKAVEKAEAYAIAEQIKNLPAEPKVTAADKEAVKAAKEAYEAYRNTEEYDSYTYRTSYSFTNALDNIKAAEKAAIEDAYKALKNKYVAGTLSYEDDAAVKALQAAIDAYIAEYSATPSETIENDVAKYAATVAALAPAYDNQDAKADLLDMSRKLTIWRTSKTSIKVTAVGSVKNIKANGYTVKYSFYKKAPGATSYKLVKTTTSNKYTYTNLKKGTNKFQVKVKVYDADGKLVATKMTYYRAAKIK